MKRLRRARHPLWTLGLTTLGILSALLMSGQAEGRAPCADGCTQACCDAGRCVWIYNWVYTPGYVSNATRGDLILDWNEGAVKTLLSSIGQTYSHMGIFVDNGSSVRHNSMSLDSVTTSGGVAWTTAVFGGNTYGDVYLNPQALYHGSPGTHTGSVAEETSDGLPEWNRSNAVLVKPLNEGTARVNANAVASAMQALSHVYSVHAYTDWAGELGTNGSNCSGSVASATQAAGLTSPYQPRIYDEGTRRTAANALFWAVRNAAREKISSQPGAWWLSSSQRDEMSAGVGDQVVSCFIYGPVTYLDFSTWQLRYGCRLMTHDWASYGIGLGYTISPDDLLNQPSDTYQNVAIPAQFVSGYWTRYWSGRGSCNYPEEPYDTGNIN
jgi:hypothetical protein